MFHQVSVNGDQVIVGKNGSGLVSSKSEPGAWHSVKNGACDCKGYQYRGRCRHLGAVAAAAGQVAPVNPTFALYAQTLAGGFGGRQHREEWNLREVAAGEHVSFGEWRERRAS